MLPSKTPQNRHVPKTELMRRAQRAVSTFHPGAPSKTFSRRPRMELFDDEQQYANEIRQDLAGQGITDEQRYDAWMSGNHKVFPPQVKELPANVRNAVKFGGLGITEEAVKLRDEHQATKRELAEATRAKEALEDSELMQHGSSEWKKRELARLDQQTDLLRKRLAETRQELHKGAFNLSDRETAREKMMAQEQRRLARVDAKQMVRADKELKTNQLNADRMAQGLSPATMHRAMPGDSDLAALVGTVARCVLAGIPTDGEWPIVVPVYKRAQYFGVLREGVRDLLDGVGKRDRAQLQHVLRKREAYELARDSWRSHLAGDEVGGVKDARDWRQQHRWEWKNEPQTYTDYDPNSNLAAFKHIADRYGERAAQGLHSLSETKPTAERPISVFMKRFGDYDRGRNSRESSSGVMNRKFYANKAGSAPFIAARLRKA